MANIFTHFQASLLSKPELAETSKPLMRKTFEKTERETKDYDKWKSSSKVASMLLYLSNECQRHLSFSGKTHDGIDFYSLPKSRGFRLHPALTKFPDAHVKHLFDFLKERLLTLDYHAVISETTVFNRADYWIETIHRHVVKATNETVIGGFDEITIELLLKDDRLCTLRLEATVLDSEMPRPTDDFAQLIQLLPA
ncbi:MAG: hypothetical protein JNL70_07795 [Saprospiraceae bacterium]|nr:hypothetical protein [Saprospiraceae bacterium]